MEDSFILKHFIRFGSIRKLCNDPQDNSDLKVSDDGIRIKPFPPPLGTLSFWSWAIV